jgi:hypothetical protein
MTRVSAALLALALLLGAGDGMAQIYRYVDETGTVRYTDDLGAVPPEFRPKSEAVPGAVEEIAPPPKTSPVDAGSPSRAEEAEALVDALEAERQSLKEEQAGIKKEGESLAERKRLLEAEREEILNSRGFRGNRADDRTIRRLRDLQERTEALREEVRAHNEKTARYNEKAAAHAEKVEEAKKRFGPK